jgi:predicted nucleic acid-binding Zn ribbon protein
VATVSKEASTPRPPAPAPAKPAAKALTRLPAKSVPAPPAASRAGAKSKAGAASGAGSSSRAAWSKGGASRPRWQPKRRETMLTPETSGSLMDQVLARIGGSGRALEFRVFDCYSRSVGEMLRLRTEPERLSGTTLFVRVASSALAHELGMLKREILDKMARTLGPELVSDLRARVGTLSTR